MTNETIELRTTVEGLHWFMEITAKYWASPLTRMPEGTILRLAELAADAYPAGEPCES